MRKFFYTATKSPCDSFCQFQSCPYRYLAHLREMHGLESIRPLFGDVNYVSLPREMSPRHGDLIILYAGSTQALDQMVENKEYFDGLKKILVTTDSMDSNSDKCHMLEPRFITRVERDLTELAMVVQKMNDQVLLS